MAALTGVLAAPAAARSGADGFSPAEVRDFQLPAGYLYPGDLAAGSDGHLWFAGRREETGRPAYSRDMEGVISRVSLDGEVTTLRTPGVWPRAIADAPGGAWFLGVGSLGNSVFGRIAADGTRWESGLRRGYPGDFVAGPDGNLWITAGGGGPEAAILRATPSGEVTEFPLPTPESGAGAITLGPDGNFWFTEYFTSRIGRITPSGQLTEFPSPHRPVGGITAGPDGNLWFVDENGVARITPTGQVSTFPVDQASGAITAGPDGRLWFGQTALGTIGRITPSGRVSTVKLPFAESDVKGIAVGPDGALWYTAVGDGPCEGGGGTCMVYRPDNPGIVGRITPGALTVEIVGRRIMHRARWAGVRLTCEGGVATSVCRGRLRLTGRGKVLAKRRYRIGVDLSKVLKLRLTGVARRALRRQGYLQAAAVATVRGGDQARDKIVIRRTARADLAG